MRLYSLVMAFLLVGVSFSSLRGQDYERQADELRSVMRRYGKWEVHMMDEGLAVVWTSLCRPITNLSIFSGFHVCYLAGEARVDDLFPLRSLPLWKLHLWNTNVTNVDVLAQIPSLREVSLFSERLNDLSALKGLKLISLDLSCGVTNLDFMKGMPLKNVGLYACSNLAEISAIASVTNLRSLELRNTKVADLSPLKNLNLRWLDISGTAVTNLSPLNGMPLKTFFMDDTSVQDLKPLAGMPLEWISLKRTPVTDLSPLLDSPITSISVDWAAIKIGRELKEKVDTRGAKIYGGATIP